MHTEHQYEGAIALTLLVFLGLRLFLGLEQAMIATALVGMLIGASFHHWAAWLGGLAALCGAAWYVSTISPTLIALTIFVGAGFAAHAANLEWHGRYAAWKEYAGYLGGGALLVVGFSILARGGVVLGVFIILAAALVPHLCEEWKHDTHWLHMHCTKQYLSRLFPCKKVRT